MADESTQGSVTRMIAQLDLEQPSQAQEALWNRYFCRLVALAKMKLGETPQRVADAEDVAVNALADFFLDHRAGKFPSLRDRNELWPLLATITSHKAVDQQRQLFAQKRGIDQVRGDSIRRDENTWLSDWPAEKFEQELQPDYLLMMQEQCDRLLSTLGDDELRTIARRRLEGYTNREIASELGVIERTVERRVRLIRTLWEDVLDEQSNAR
jgi:DNA-directed RNA polymerase specialized sigma24 family protein